LALLHPDPDAPPPAAVQLGSIVPRPSTPRKGASSIARSGAAGK
jgi:hypothetical protein